MYGNKQFDAQDHKKYLGHEKIENLIGLEIELVYEWELGSMLIFDRTNLHCSSSKIEGKKYWLNNLLRKNNLWQYMIASNTLTKNTLLI